MAPSTSPLRASGEQSRARARLCCSSGAGGILVMWLTATLLRAGAVVPQDIDYSGMIDQLLAGTDVYMAGRGFWLRIACSTIPWLQPCSAGESLLLSDSCLVA